MAIGLISLSTTPPNPKAGTNSPSEICSITDAENQAGRNVYLAIRLLEYWTKHSFDRKLLFRMTSRPTNLLQWKPLSRPDTRLAIVDTTESASTTWHMLICDDMELPQVSKRIWTQTCHRIKLHTWYVCLFYLFFLTKLKKIDMIDLHTLGHIPAKTWRQQLPSFGSRLHFEKNIFAEKERLALGLPNLVQTS